MNTLSNFGNFALTRAEMKSVRGGACYLWSLDSNGQMHLAPDSMSKNQAKKKSKQYNLQYGAGYGWCCDSGC